VGPHSAHRMSCCLASQGDRRGVRRHPFGVGPLLQLCLPSHRDCPVWCLSQAVNSSDTYLAAREPKSYGHRAHTYQELPPFRAASSCTPCASGRDKEGTTAPLLFQVSVPPQPHPPPRPGGNEHGLQGGGAPALMLLRDPRSGMNDVPSRHR